MRAMGPGTGGTISAGAQWTEHRPKRQDLTATSTHSGGPTISFQAYLDNIEEKTGKTPNDFIAMAKEKGFDAPATKAGTIVDWLKADYGLGRGHAMALVYVIKNGAGIGDKHVDSGTTHSDPSNTLKLTGKDS
jgi:uncharacterized protein DUF4287